jgi:hypothetical protein
VSDFQRAQRRILAERFDRLQKLIELKAPQTIVDSAASVLIRGLIAAVGPGAFKDIGKWIIDAWKRDTGICPFCKEERPTMREIAPSGIPWGMCQVCHDSVQKDDEDAAKLEAAAESEEEAAN